MMSLVADYGSSDNESDQDMPKAAPEPQDTSSDTEDSSDARSIEEETKDSSQKVKLPSARDILGAPGGVGVQGVLTNKFKAAEDQKIANLERHVKMVNTDLNTKTKNGKKICWSYRKGRCRFGSACTFAHDSDIQATDDAKKIEQGHVGGSSEEKVQKTKVPSGITDKVKKKRPGLSNTLVPGKKVVQMYKHLKNS